MLDEVSRAGYRGIELGPVGYMPEDAGVLGDSLESYGLTLVGGVLFQPFHDADAWSDLLVDLRRTARLLQELGAEQLALIDSIAAERSGFAGDSDQAPRLGPAQAKGIHERLGTAARIGRDEYGLVPVLHAHAGGYIEFEDELDRALDAVDESLLGVCLDTGHSLYAGFDAEAVLRRLGTRVRYVHLKDLDRDIHERSVAEGIGFYEACARGVFCNLGQGSTDFEALAATSRTCDYKGWMTVEQDRGPASIASAFEDARANLEFLRAAGMASN